jgi:hypothetical protein
LGPYQEAAAEVVLGKESAEAFTATNAAATMVYFHSNMDARVLNYGPDAVNTSVGAMETDTVGGLTQDMYSTEDDHHDSNNIDFDAINHASFNAWQAISERTVMAYQAWVPRLKELASLCEHDTPEEIRR